MAVGTKPRRTRVERSIYRQADGNFAACARRRRATSLRARPARRWSGLR